GAVALGWEAEGESTSGRASQRDAVDHQGAVEDGQVAEQSCADLGVGRAAPGSHANFTTAHLPLPLDHGPGLECEGALGESIAAFPTPRCTRPPAWPRRGGRRPGA